MSIMDQGHGSKQVETIRLFRVDVDFETSRYRVSFLKLQPLHIFHLPLQGAYKLLMPGQLD
jgi:hypothetical protein